MSGGHKGDRPSPRSAAFVRDLRRRIDWRIDQAGQRLADAGVSPVALGRRWVRHEPACLHAERTGSSRVIHEAGIVTNPLPANIPDRNELPRDPGWWGFSFHDVPRRKLDATRLLTLGEARVISWREPDGRRDFYPAILSKDGASLDLREIRYRRFHAAAAEAAPVRRLKSGTWIAERVYHNHSHWLTAHLPKLIVLREMGLLDDLVLPAERGEAIDASLRLLGIAPEACVQYADGESLAFESLRVLETDRFRPELLRPVRQALARPGGGGRRIFISRARARGRKLLEEQALSPLLSRRGVERVVMEDLDFEAQLSLMQETSVLIAPHGAGLTNMMFCPEGAHVIEIADPAYPNPNFYALASAMGHRYHLVRARGIGGGHPLDQDLSVAAEDLRAVLQALPT